jgi:hypothetical protein
LVRTGSQVSSGGHSRFHCSTTHAWCLTSAARKLTNGPVSRRHGLLSPAKAFHVFQIHGEILGESAHAAGQVAGHVVTRGATAADSLENVFARLSHTSEDFVVRLDLASCSSWVKRSPGNFSEMVRIGVPIQAGATESAAWYELRTSGPDSTWTKPIS